MQSGLGFWSVVVLAGGAGITAIGCGNAAVAPRRDAAQPVDGPVSSGGLVGTGGLTNTARGAQAAWEVSELAAPRRSARVGPPPTAKLGEWISWAPRSRLKPFKKAARTIRKYIEGIVAIVTTGLNNGRTEGLNGKIRVITRRAFGFHSARALISFIFLCCSGLILNPVFNSSPLFL